MHGAGIWDGGEPRRLASRGPVSEGTKVVTDEARSEWRARLRSLPPIFWVIVAVGIGLRIYAFDAYSAHHPDEIIQYLEQAHRRVFGYGIVPWEFRYVMRSWLIPLAVTGPMQLGEWLQPGGTLYLILPRALVAALNFSPVIAAWFIGARTSRQHAIVAMAVTALWVESVMFSVHTLSESMAVASFMPAAALLRPEARLRSIVAAGFLMALAGLLRFQYAPAIAVYAMFAAGRDARLWKGLVIGGLPVLAGGAAIDLAMGLVPYQWVWTNFRLNVTEARMLEHGGLSAWTYVNKAWAHMKFAAPLILILSLFAGRAYRPLLIAAAFNIGFHQLIGHREYRYLWLSLQILLVLAAIGSVNVAGKSIAGRHLARPGSTAVTAALLLLWGSASLALTATKMYRGKWRENGDPARLGAMAGRDPTVCGLAVPMRQFTEFGYVLVHRPIPIYLLDARLAPTLARPGEAAAAFNAMIVPANVTPPPGYGARIGCGGRPSKQVCLYRRPGGCAPNAASAGREYQRVLLSLDR